VNKEEMKMSSITEELANFALETKWEDLPPSIVHETKRVIMTELERRIKAQNNGDGDKIEKEIKSIYQRLSRYEAEEQRLIKLYRHDEIKEDLIYKELNQLKFERRDDQKNWHD
jgi:phage terminase small subunit